MNREITILLILFNSINVNCVDNERKENTNVTKKIVVKDGVKNEEDRLKLKGLLEDNITTMINKTSIIRNPNEYCQAFKSCSKCMKSIWYKCGWCHNYGCTYKYKELCPSANTDSCAKIVFEEETGILFASGVRKNLKLKLYAPDPVVFDKEIICQIKLRDRVTHLRGLIMDDTVYCYAVVLKIDENEKSEAGSFQLIWGGVNPISNEIPITVYRCEAMGLDCESCIKIRKEFGCGWCSKRSSCVIGDKCTDDYMQWTLNRMLCSDYKKNLYYV